MTPRYLTDSAGARWRVVDVRFARPHHPPGQWSWHEPPDSAASFRAFVGQASGIGGQREARSYHWAAGEDRRDVSDATLQRQLRAAGWWDRRPVSALIPGYTPSGTRGSSG